MANPLPILPLRPLSRSIDERNRFLLTAVDFHLEREEDDMNALRKALSDYRYVYYPEEGDERTPLQRSSERVLEHLEQDGWK